MTTQKLTGGQMVVDFLIREGVEKVFAIPGHGNTALLDAFVDRADEIELVPAMHEQGAAHMADGYARVSNRHGVVIGQNGPGISNCVTAIAAAFWAHSPVVIVTPEAGTMGTGLGGFQEANQLPMFQEFTKYQGHVNNPKRCLLYTSDAADE